MHNVKVFNAYRAYRAADFSQSPSAAYFLRKAHECADYANRVRKQAAKLPESSVIRPVMLNEAEREAKKGMGWLQEFNRCNDRPRSPSLESDERHDKKTEVEA